MTGWFAREIAAGGAVDEETEEGGQQGSVFGLLALLGLLGFVWYQWGFWLFATVVALILCVFLHEAGHFMTARATGMKVTQFFLGFGPRLWSMRRGEVEYGVRALPLGAFVRIIGMNNLDEVAPEDEPYAYRNKPYWSRVLVASAGSLMHFAIAFLLLGSMFAFFGREVGTGQYRVGEVVEGSAAEKAGVLPGDRVLAFDDTPLTDYAVFVEVLRASSGEPVRLTLERDGRERVTTAYVEPRLDDAGQPVLDEQGEPVGFLGIASDEIVERESLGPFEAIGTSAGEFGRLSKESVLSLAHFFSPSGLAEFVDHLTGSSDDLATRPSSVVGVAQQGGVLGERGVADWLFLVAVFNIFIGLFNLLPVLPFDGGHIAIATYEAIRSRNGAPYHADVAKMIPVAITVVALLTFLFFGALYLDLADPIGG